MSTNPASTSPSGARTLGAWRISLETGVLRRGEHEARLTVQQMRLLELLIDNAGQTLDKETIFEHVWNGEAVEENALARCISELRRALGDDARAPRYIETLPKRGYRLIAPVGPADRAVADESESTPATAPTTASTSSRRGPLLVALAALALAAVFVPLAGRYPDFAPGSQEGASRDAPFVGSRLQEAQLATSRGVTAARAALFEDAEAEFRHALEIYRAMDVREQIGAQLVNLARTHLHRGQWAEAAAAFVEAEPILAIHGDDRQYALLLVNLGTAHAATGHLRLAEPVLVRAVESFRRLEDPHELSHALGLLGEVLVDRGDPTAREVLEEALDLRAEIGDPVRIANSRNALAVARLEAGELDAAIEHARATLRLEGTTPNQEVLAWRLVARAHLAAGRAGEARRAIEEARERLTPSNGVPTNAYSRLWVPITLARIEAVEGERAAAAQRLEALLAAEAIRDLRLIEAEARLALAEIELASGEVDRASGRLADLLVEAEAAGWSLLASKASRTSASVLDAGEG